MNFYPEEEVKNLLYCDSCENKLNNSIKVIPCGKTICEQCATQLEFKDGSFDCKLCLSNHKGYDFWNELPDNLKLMKIMKLKPAEIYLGKEAAAIKSKINELKALRTKFESRLNNPSSVIKEYCCTLRNEIQTAYERLLEHLNDNLKESNNYIDKYEIELKSQLKNDRLDILRTEYKNFNENMKPFFKDWYKNLINVAQANNEVLSYEKSLTSFMSLFNKEIFKDEILEFSENDFSSTKIGVFKNLSTLKNETVACKNNADNFYKEISFSTSNSVSVMAVVKENFLACCSKQGVELYNLMDGTLIKASKIDEVTSAIYIKEHDCILAGTKTFGILKYDSNLELVARYHEHNGDILSLCTLAESFASSSSHKSIYLWEYAASNPYHFHNPIYKFLKAHTCSITSLIALNDNHFLSRSIDNVIKLWSKKQKCNIKVLNNDNSIAKLPSLLLSNGTFISTTNGEQLKLWILEKTYDYSQSKTITTINQIKCLVELNSNLVAVISNDQLIQIWNIDDGSLFKEIETENYIHIIKALDESFLIICFSDSTAKVIKYK